MNVGIIFGVGFGIGAMLLASPALIAAEANASVPLAAAPIQLMPEAYTASSAPVVPIISPRSAPLAPIAPPPSATAVAVASLGSTPVVRTAAPHVEIRSFTPVGPSIAGESQDRPAAVIKLNQYHPHWVVSLH
jgi:hypothetical protein